MSVVRSLFSELVERRLWPLAVGLLVALVAVPVLLSKPADEGASTAPSSAAPLLGANSAKLLGETRPAITVRGDGGFRKRVNRLARKNPFVQQARPKKQKADGVTLPGTGTTTGTPVPTSGTPTGTGTPTTGTDPVRLYRYVAKVSFGKIGSTKEKTVDPGEFMPSEKNPVVLYIASSDDGQEALFLVTPGATARGDGRCSPSSSDCQTLKMSKGDVEFIEVQSSSKTVTYELELVDIVLRQVKNPPEVQDKKPIVLRPNSPKVDRMRQAMRAKRVFNALDKLGF